MRYLLAVLTALLTLACGVILLRALLSLGSGGFGVVVGGVSQKLLGLICVLSVIFIILLAIHRRRERRERT